MDPLGRDLRPRKQGLGGQQVVAFRIIRAHAALVCEPQVHAGPVDRLLGEQLVGAFRGGAAAERDVGDAALGAHVLQLSRDVGGRPGRDGLGVGAGGQAGQLNSPWAERSAGT